MPVSGSALKSTTTPISPRPDSFVYAPVPVSPEIAQGPLNMKPSLGRALACGCSRMTNVPLLSSQTNNCVAFTLNAAGPSPKCASTWDTVPVEQMGPVASKVPYASGSNVTWVTIVTACGVSASTGVAAHDATTTIPTPSCETNGVNR